MINWIKNYFAGEQVEQVELRDIGPTPLSAINTELARKLGLYDDLGISETSALSLAPVFCAINVIAQAVGTFDIYVYSELEDKKEEARANPIFDLLLKNPNPETTPQAFWETFTATALLWGNSVAEIQTTVAGEPVALWQIPPEILEIGKDDVGLFYKITLANNEYRILRSYQVLHISGLSPDGSIGYQMCRLARLTLQINKATDEYTNSFFANGCRPSGTLTIPTNLSDAAKKNIISGIKSLNTGAKNAHKILPLTDDCTFDESTNHNDNNQLTETRNTNAIAVCQYFNLPIHKMKLSVGERPGGNIEAENLSFLHDTLTPWLRKIAQECTKKLLQKGYIAEHDTSNYLSQYMFQTLQIGVMGGWILKSEARNWIGLNPIDGIDEVQSPIVANTNVPNTGDNNAGIPQQSN